LENQIGTGKLAPAQQRAKRVFALLWLSLEISRDAALIPKTSPVRDVIAWAWSNFLGSREAETLSPEAQSVDDLLLWLKTNPSQCVRTGADWGHDILAWYDSTTVYIPKASLMRIPCISSSSERAVAEELRRRGLLIEAARKDRKEYIHGFIPGGPGHVRHYRLAYRIRSGADTEEQQAEGERAEREAREAGGDAVSRFNDRLDRLH
jgi:hypothetical protein